MEEKELALIIPAYNAHNTIRRLFHSISMFKFIDRTAIILVDDCSDESYEYLEKEFPDLDLTIMILDHNLGPGVARNYGMQEAFKKNIPYIFFSDADDYFVNFEFWDKISPEDKKNNDLFVFKFYSEGGHDEFIDYDLWCFGKIYKSEIIKKYNIIFGNNKCNEDVAFNFIFYPMVQGRIRFYNKLIYYWSYSKNSLSNGEGYIQKSLKEMPRLFTEAYEKYNFLFSIEQKKTILLRKLMGLFILANQTMSLKLLDIYDDKDNLLENLKIFYKKCYSTVEQYITIEDIIEMYRNIQINEFLWIDFLSFVKLLKN